MKKKSPLDSAPSWNQPGSRFPTPSSGLMCGGGGAIGKLGPRSREERAGGSPGSHWPEQAAASAGSAWAVVPTITGARAGRGLPGARVWGRNPDWGGGWDASQGRTDWRREMRGGGARGVGRGANGSTEERACWLGDAEGDGPEPTEDWPWRAVKAWPARARGSARERATALPASRSPGRARRAGVGLRNAAREARPPAALRGSSTPLPSLPSLALRPGVSGRGAEGRDEGGGGFAEWGAEGVPERGEARAASHSPAAAFASSPGAAAPGRPHYAGGLPAAAMASRAVVRAGHSPHRFLVRAAAAAPARAAIPLSRSYPLPPRSNSSSPSSFPMPLFLLLLLILLLLLEDAGAQQGEWFPRSARHAEPRGGRGGGVEGASWAPGVRAVNESADARGRCGALRCVSRPGPALAGLSWWDGLSVVPQVGAALLLGNPIHFSEKRELRLCCEGLLLGIVFFYWGKSWRGKEVWRCDP